MNKFLLVLVSILVALVGMVYFVFFNNSSQNPPIVIDSNGGTVYSTDNKVSLFFPSNAVKNKLTISITPSEMNVTEEGVVLGTIYEFGPKGNFDKPVLLTIKYNPTQIPSITSENMLYISRWNGTAWNMIINSVVDKNARTVSAYIEGFSKYCVQGFYIRFDKEKYQCLPGGDVRLTIKTNSNMANRNDFLEEYTKFSISSNYGQFAVRGESPFRAGIWAVNYIFNDFNLIYKAFPDVIEGNDTMEITYHGRIRAQGAVPPEIKLSATVEIAQTGVRLECRPIGRYPESESRLMDYYYVKNNTMTTITCRFYGDYDSSKLVFHWQCTSTVGYIVDRHNTVQPYTKDFKLKSSKVYYYSDDTAPDGAYDKVKVSVYYEDGTTRELIGSHEILIEIWNPTHWYTLIRGPIYGGQMDAYLYGVPGGVILNQFKARPGQTKIILRFSLYEGRDTMTVWDLFILDGYYVSLSNEEFEKLSRSHSVGGVFGEFNPLIDPKKGYKEIVWTI